MYKSITAFLLLVALLLQIFNRIVIYIDYYNNVAVYAKDCENKAMPQMHCNGKCQMENKINTHDKKDGQVPERKSVNDEVISFTSFFASIDYTLVNTTSLYNNFSGCRLSSMPRFFFHPPGV